LQTTITRIKGKAIENESPKICANSIIYLIKTVICLPAKQIQQFEKDFPQHGGLRERMTKTGIESRNRQKKQSNKFKTTEIRTYQDSSRSFHEILRHLVRQRMSFAMRRRRKSHSVRSDSRIKILYFLFLLTPFTVEAQSLQNVYSDTLLQYSANPTPVPRQKNRFWKATGEVVALNLGIHLFDRYILNAEWARITGKSIRYNLTHPHIWDNDMMSTNFFGHPYCGGLYFNSARSNGFNFWQSIPFAIGGSYIWESFGESQPASLNDIIATPVGGIALGEITHRISHLVLDDSKRGWERFGVEMLAGIISPMDLLNRILNGKAWRYRPKTYENESLYLRQPFHINLSVSNRFVTDLEENSNNLNMGINIETSYGQIFNGENHSPYDFFMGEIETNFIGGQPLLSSMSVIGLIWGKEWSKNKNEWFAGIFQHFDYYNSNPLINGGKRLYEFAETASLGGGLYYQKRHDKNKPPRFSGGLHTNFIILGASESDYYVVDDRNYNLGNGYSVKLYGTCLFGKRWNVSMGVKHYYIFTSKGYGSLEAEISGLPDGTDFNYANVQGNKGKAHLSRINLNIGYRLSPKIMISAEQRFYVRQTLYTYLDDVTTFSTDNCIKFTYMLFDTENR
jgi:four helix bundle suffix protein